MNLSLYSAATGMEAQELNLNTIANNLANVNTPGFKRSKIEFQDLLYQKPRPPARTPAAATSSPTGLEVGNGTRVAATSKVFTQGQLSQTGNSSTSRSRATASSRSRGPTARSPTPATARSS
jgi:flagellar basal-body rod protein FlgG